MPENGVEMCIIIYSIREADDRAHVNLGKLLAFVLLVSTELPRF